MRAGRLRHRVSIQARSGARDSHGQLVDDWAETASRMASVEPLNGKEFFAAAGENTEISVRVRFRYEPNLIDETKRIVFKDLVLDTERPINPGMRNRELICMCRHVSQN